MRPAQLAAWVLVGVACALAPRPVEAQGQWLDRGRLTLSAGLQPDVTPLSESFALRRYEEDGSVRVEAPAAGVPVFDIGGMVRLAGNLGAGVAVSFVTVSKDVAVEAEIPHPLFLSQPRSVEGTAAGVEHRERAVHATVVYMIPTRQVDVALFAGPSFFRVEQDLVTDVTFTETYPYDTAEFGSAILRRASASATGYNVGADVTWRAGRQWGLGALIRFSRAEVPIAASGVSLGDVEVGGLQAAGGVRLIF